MAWFGFSVETPENSLVMYSVSATAETGSSNAASEVLKGSYLELCLGSTSTGFAGLSASDSPSLLNLIQVIQRAEQDRNIRGIVINTTGFSADREILWELRKVLESFKAGGKKIVAYGNYIDFDLYCFLSVANKIVMDELGSLSFEGYAFSRGYYRDALDKLGIGVRELRYLDYKSTMESYTRTTLSQADREQYGQYLDDIFAVTKEVIMQARGFSEDDFNIMLNREFLFSAGQALERGLVDLIGRADVLDKTVEELEGRAVDSYTVYGNSNLSLLDTGKSYRSWSLNLPWNTATIAVVNALGQTDMDTGMKARELARTIREVSSKKSIKAMVIRIDSPGGNAEAADYIAEAIHEAKTRMPVVVSMGLTAASGGYWAAMNAHHIAASPYTLTGSIGVISSWLYDKGLEKKLGLSLDILVRGTHADLNTGLLLPHRDLTSSEEARYKTQILELYNLFVRKVAVGRNMKLEAVEALAQGRVYSGEAAKDNGLVDSLGGLADALRIARELAWIPNSKTIVIKEYPKPTTSENPLLQYLSMFLAVPAGKLSSFWDDFQYRLFRNGQAMPILPLDLL
jgi:protease-4